MAEPDGGPAPSTARPWSGGGREELAEATRRLIALTTTSMAPPDLLADVARRLAPLSEELEPFVPAAGPVPIARFAERSVTSGQAPGLAAAMPFDVIIGSCNPLAPPVTIEFDPPKAIGRAQFTAPYEGAPGCVHGAVLAGAFDMMLTAANVLADGAGPTVALTIRYLRPTVISDPALFEAWVTSKDDRRTHSRGHLIQNGVVTVEATGEFVHMERARVEAMHRRDAVRKGRGPQNA